MITAPLFDDLGHKRCARCGQGRPLQEFRATLRPSGSLKFGGYCAPCHKAYQHEWYLKNREKVRAATAERKAPLRAKGPPKPARPERRPRREAIGFQRHDNPRMHSPRRRSRLERSSNSLAGTTRTW